MCFGILVSSNSNEYYGAAEPLVRCGEPRNNHYPCQTATAPHWSCNFMGAILFGMGQWANTVYYSSLTLILFILCKIVPYFEKKGEYLFQKTFPLHIQHFFYKNHNRIHFSHKCQLFHSI